MAELDLEAARSSDLGSRIRRFFIETPRLLMPIRPTAGACGVDVQAYSLALEGLVCLHVVLRRSEVLVDCAVSGHFRPEVVKQSRQHLLLAQGNLWVFGGAPRAVDRFIIPAQVRER